MNYIKKCKNCGKDFTVTIENSKRQICSTYCSRSNKNKIVKCKYCNKNFECKLSSKKEFCSKLCSSAKNGPSKRKSIKCIICGNESFRMKYCNTCSDNVRKEKEKKRSKQRYKDKFSLIANKLKRIFVSMLGGECSKCGYKKCMAALTFHHVDDKLKLFTLDAGNLLMKHPELLINELEKCIILCQNCHTQHHQNLRDSNINITTYTKLKPLYVTKKLKLIQKFGAECEKCNLKFNTNNIQTAVFHHMRDKKFNINCDAFLRKTEDELIEESNKTKLICQNCHMEEHWLK